MHHPSDAEGGGPPAITPAPTVPGDTHVAPSPSMAPCEATCFFVCLDCEYECSIARQEARCHGNLQELEVCRSVPGEPDDCSATSVCLYEWTCLISSDPCNTACDCGRVTTPTSDCGDHFSKCGSCTCGPGSTQEDVVMRGVNSSTWQHEDTHISCNNCTLGHFNGVDARSACEECFPGYVASSNGSTACTPCSPGASAPLAGSSACQECSPGTFAAHAYKTTSMQWNVMEPCEDCAPGYFAAAGLKTRPSVRNAT